MSTLHATRAVVLRTFKHGDRSTVLKAYTEGFGARTYMVRTGKRSGASPAHLQPLARVELVVTESKERDMHAVREIRLTRPYVGIPGDPFRGLLLLFAQEVFYRTLREESPDAALFAFVLQVLEDMDTGERPEYQPLLLLVRLARHLGFRPEPPQAGEDHFDLREGCFFKGVPAHGFCMDAPCSSAFGTLLGAEASGIGARLEPAVRKHLLDQLLLYYRMHVEGFGQLKSPAVLHALLA